jgi:hypothetical protein
MNTLQDDLDIQQTENSMHPKSTHYFLNMDIFRNKVIAINKLSVIDGSLLNVEKFEKKNS